MTTSCTKLRLAGQIEVEFKIKNFDEEPISTWRDVNIRRPFSFVEQVLVQLEIIEANFLSRWQK